MTGKSVVDTFIHTMTDASQLAYETLSHVGKKTVRFEAAKAKVAPTKATSIPGLQLMAAVLAFLGCPRLLGSC